MAQPPRSGLSITHGPGRGENKKEAASAAMPQRATAHTQIMTVEVTGSRGVRATSANPARDLRRVKSGFAAIWINKHKRAGT